MGKISVLIVDDSAVVRDGLESILQAYPDIKLVGKAENGSEGIAKAERLQPRVILMDVQMPGMDGVEATQRVKKRLPHIKVLALTVHTEYISKVLAAGADRCLLKDCDRRELVQALRELGSE